MRQIISSQNKLMWWLRAFVATWAMSHSRAYCRKSRFVTNTRFFGFVLSRLLLRHLGFDSDFAQISAQKIGGWGLWCMISKVFISYRGHIILNSQNIFIQGAWYPNYSYYTGGITSKVFIYRVHNSLSPIWQLPEWCCLSNRWHVCFLSMLGC